jgi:integrase
VDIRGQLAVFVAGMHDARHTAATVLLLGVHVRTIMSVLGWSTTAMVGRYAHVIAPIHEDLATRLDGLLWSGLDGGTSND